jgi:hypothetical protein
VRVARVAAERAENPHWEIAFLFYEAIGRLYTRIHHKS